MFHAHPSVFEAIYVLCASPQHLHCLFLALEYLPPTRDGETDLGKDPEGPEIRLCGSVHHWASDGLQGITVYLVDCTYLITTTKKSKSHYCIKQGFSNWGLQPHLGSPGIHMGSNDMSSNWKKNCKVNTTCELWGITHLHYHVTWNCFQPVYLLPYSNYIYVCVFTLQPGNDFYPKDKDGKYIYHHTDLCATWEVRCCTHYICIFFNTNSIWPVDMLIELNHQLLIGSRSLQRRWTCQISRSFQLQPQTVGAAAE